jgi:hypothetical protein
LVNWAGTCPSSESSYQRIKKARFTLLRDISCLSEAKAAEAVWYDALEAMKNICHAWWPAGPFNSYSGLPSADDVKSLRIFLLKDLPTEAVTSRGPYSVPSVSSAVIEPLILTTLPQQHNAPDSASPACFTNHMAHKSLQGPKSPMGDVKMLPTLLSTEASSSSGSYSIPNVSSVVIEPPTIPAVPRQHNAAESDPADLATEHMAHQSLEEP